MELLFEFMYKGRVTIDFADLEDFMEIGANLNFKGIGYYAGKKKIKKGKFDNIIFGGKRKRKQYSQLDKDAAIKFIQEGDLISIFDKISNLSL